MDNEIIAECKTFIETNDFEGLKEHYRQLLWIEYPRTPDWPYIFHRVYLHACLKGCAEIADWLNKSVYQNMDQIQQVALRQIFPYGRMLLARARRTN